MDVKEESCEQISDQESQAEFLGLTGSHFAPLRSTNWRF